MRDPAVLLAAGGSNAALFTFLVYTLAVFGLAALANRLLKGRGFLSEYFLGSRSLGVWAFALTFAATSASGGSFTGFPSKIYTHGWILALWIGSYMVVPIFTIGLMGKRINQVARISGAITVPDVIRDRFGSRSFGLLATVFIIFFTSFNLVAQFKAGREILRTLLQDVGLFQSSSAWLGEQVAGIGFFAGVEPQYLLCLLAFGVAVILYTTWGGFHAVVWTDVMQGVVMVGGVLIMLPLALWSVGGLESATREMEQMTPPVRGYVDLEGARGQLERGDWVRSADGMDVFRLAEAAEIGPEGRLAGIDVLQVTSPGEIKRILAGETSVIFRDEAVATTEPARGREYGTVTLTRDSDAADLLPVGAVVSLDSRRFQVQRAVNFAGRRVVDGVRVYTDGPRAEDGAQPVIPAAGYTVSDVQVQPVQYAWGADSPGVYVTGPGPSPSSSNGFLPFGLAVSFFFMWCMAGAGQPNFMVRLMAFNRAATLRRGIMTVTIYFSLIYLPLVIIFCCARVLLPGMEIESDRIMPAMALHLTEGVGLAWLAGLLIAAPFAAVMSTVDSFLLVISSAVVRDVYQRNINPEASERRMKWMSYGCTLLVGTIAMLGAVNPPQFLQDIIVYVGSGLAACFLAPMVFGLYWPRINTAGAMSGMLAGFGAHFSMYLVGMFRNGSFFSPYRLFGFDPTVVGLVASFAAVLIVTRLTPPPPEELVRRYFCKRGSASSAS